MVGDQAPRGGLEVGNQEKAVALALANHPICICAHGSGWMVSCTLKHVHDGADRLTCHSLSLDCCHVHMKVAPCSIRSQGFEQVLQLKSSIPACFGAAV